MADEGQKRNSTRKSITVKEAPEGEPPVPATGAGAAVATAGSSGKRTSGPKKNASDKSDDIMQQPGNKKDVIPGNLAGTLQNLFTQTAQAEGPALKPLRRPKLIYQNTYRLWPYRPFSTDKVRTVLETTLEEMLEKVRYKSDTSNDIAMKVAERVRGRVLGFRFDRYKIIVLINLGPLNRQGLHIGTKFLWDPLRDSYVSYTYKNPSIFCNCVVYGVYFE